MMPRNVSAAITGVIVCATLLPVHAQQSSSDTLPTLLQRLGRYVDVYERDLAMVVSEENYLQQIQTRFAAFGTQRTLRSDLLLSKTTELGWVGFRDVFEVDGKPVRDRSDRLVQLFLSPTAESRDQVRRVVEESARLNVGWVNRTINVPTMVLQFARSAEQHRSEFKRGGTDKLKSIATREIRFQEKALPRVIDTPDGAASEGRFWIEEATGRVVKTELRLTTNRITASVVVAYELQPQTKLWVPVEMEEYYSAPNRPAITGRATYKNFRQFNVTVAERIK